jgi:hypothetical protein
VPSTSEPVATAVARGGHRPGSLAITAGIVGGALLIFIFAIYYSSRGGVTLRTTTNPATVAPEGVSDADAVQSVELQRALGWVDGLAAGLILPSDVTNRLQAHDPRIAKVIMSAWSDLKSSGSAIRLQESLRWVDGLVAGLILPSDVTSRLQAQDPRMAKVVMSAWSDLNEVGTDGLGS